MNFNRLFKEMAIITGATSALLLAGCGKRADATAETAVMPEANMVVVCDIAEARKAPFYTAMKKMAEEKGDVAAEMSQTEKLMEQHLGLKESDFLRFAMGVKVNKGADMKALDKDLEKNAEIVIGVEVAKPVTLDQVQAFIQATADAEKAKPVFERETIAGTPALAIGKEGETEKIHLAMVTGNKVMLGGGKSGLENALGRIGKSVSKADLAAAGVPVGQNPQSYLMVSLSPEMKSALNAKIDEDLASNSGNPVANNAMKCLKNMDGGAITVTLNQGLDFALRMNLADAEQATTLKGIFDNSVVTMIRFLASMATGGQPLPVLDTLKTEVVKDVASLTFTFSQTDVDTINKIAAQKADAMKGNAPPMPMPK